MNWDKKDRGLILGQLSIVQGQLIITQRGDGAQQAKDKHTKFESFACGYGSLTLVFFSATRKKYGGNKACDCADQRAK
jgi:hypothetical protein